MYHYEHEMFTEINHTFTRTSTSVANVMFKVDLADMDPWQKWLILQFPPLV